LTGLKLFGNPSSTYALISTAYTLPFSVLPSKSLRDALAELRFAWDTGGRSSLELFGDVAYTFQVTAASIQVATGLSDPTRITWIAPSEIEYGFYISKGYARVIESGRAVAGLYIPYDSNDTFGITRRNQVIEYRKNGLVVYVSSRPCTSLSLVTLSSLYAPGDEITTAGFVSLPANWGAGSAAFFGLDALGAASASGGVGLARAAPLQAGSASGRQETSGQSIFPTFFSVGADSANIGMSLSAPTTTSGSSVRSGRTGLNALEARGFSGVKGVGRAVMRAAQVVGRQDLLPPTVVGGAIATFPPITAADTGTSKITGSGTAEFPAVYSLGGKAGYAEGSAVLSPLLSEAYTKYQFIPADNLLVTAIPKPTLDGAAISGDIGYATARISSQVSLQAYSGVDTTASLPTLTLTSTGTSPWGDTGEAIVNLPKATVSGHITGTFLAEAHGTLPRLVMGESNGGGYGQIILSTPTLGSAASTGSIMNGTLVLPSISTLAETSTSELMNFQGTLPVLHTSWGQAIIRLPI